MLRTIANFCLSFATAVAVYLTFFSPEDSPQNIAEVETMYFSGPEIPGLHVTVVASELSGMLEGFAVAASKIPNRESQTPQQTLAQRARNKLAAAELAGRFAVPDETGDVPPAKVASVVGTRTIETQAPELAHLVVNANPVVPNQSAIGLDVAHTAALITPIADKSRLDDGLIPAADDTILLSSNDSLPPEAAAEDRLALKLPTTSDATSNIADVLSQAGSSVELADGKPQRVADVSAINVQANAQLYEQTLDAKPLASMPVSRVASLPLMRVGPMPTLASDKAEQVDVAASWASNVLRADSIALDRQMPSRQQDAVSAAAELQDMSPASNVVRGTLNKKPPGVRAVTLSKQAAAALTLKPYKSDVVRVAAIGTGEAVVPPSAKSLTAWQATQPATKTKDKPNSKAASKNKQKVKSARRSSAPAKLATANNAKREVISWRPPKHKTEQYFAPLLSHCNEAGCKTDER